MKKILTILFAVVSLTAFAVNPSATYAKKPSDFGLKYEEKQVATFDRDASLNVWIIYPAAPSTKLILISHNGEGNMSNYLDRYKVFINLGYTVVAYDYRGFGKSSAFDMDNNMYLYPHFLNDIETMVDYCNKLNKGNSIDLYGFGIGAGMSFGMGWNRSYVDKIIADTPFLSLNDLDERFYKWDEPMDVPFGGYSSQYEPFNSLDKKYEGISKSVLILIGSNDILFNVADMESLRKKQTSVIQEIKVIQNPDRKANFDAEKVKYTDLIIQFLSK